MPTKYLLVRSDWHSINDRSRFANGREAAERRAPKATFTSVDEAVSALYEEIAEVIKDSGDPEATAKMAGLAQDEDWERRMDTSRHLLTCGMYAGRDTRRMPSESCTGVYVYPVDR